MFLYDKHSVIKRMKLVIPAMLLCMIGDYSIGIEPTWSKEIGIAASDGWLSISDIRITISNVAGMIGTVLFAIGAVAFMSYLYENNKDNKNRLEKGILRLFYISLFTGCLSFIYFHIACGGLIQHFNVLYELSGGDLKTAESSWIRMFMVEAIPFIVLFVAFDLFATVAWVGMILRGIIKLPKIWICAAPLVMAFIGQLFELIPLPFKGIGSGFESLGWMLMFIAGIKYINSNQNN